jgi:succinyl-CoA synthetase beta subunit
MNIHEYQARELLADRGVPVPMGEIATTPEQAEEIAARLGGAVVVKAQVHTGGRGKAGGVKLAKSAAEAREKAQGILGMDIKGSGGEGARRAGGGHRERGVRRHHRGPRQQVAPSSWSRREGGVDIEEVAATNPDAIRRLAVDPRYGLLPHQAYCWPRSCTTTSEAAARRREDPAAALRAFMDSGRLAGRDQPAHHHARRAR